MKISPRATSRRSDANTAPKAVRAGDRSFETGQETGTIHAGSPLSRQFRLGSHLMNDGLSEAVRCLFERHNFS